MRRRSTVTTDESVELGSVMRRRPTVTTDEIGVMLMLVADLNPEIFYGKDAERVRAAVYKAKSLVKKNDKGNYYVPPFQIVS